MKGNKTKKNKEKSIDFLQYEMWNNHINNVNENINYSMRRMDLLIITLCGGGLFVLFESLKELKQSENLIQFKSIIFLSGIFFLISIILNFLSQLSSYEANIYEVKYAQLQLKDIGHKTLDKGEKKSSEEFDKKKNKYDMKTKYLNLFSVLLMLSGLITIVILYVLIFWVEL
ncbi:hypothetical protein [Dokdonia sp. Asnod3-C12]|uniref:hypothetical protein n=1 Tax=Dokdonia sp. Asnod3-C12 TaxID=3160575 RepID=UPI003867E9F5